MIESDKSADERYEIERLIDRARRDIDEQVSGQLYRLDARSRFSQLIVFGLSIRVGALLTVFAMSFLDQRDLEERLYRVTEEVNSFERSAANNSSELTDLNGILRDQLQAIAEVQGPRSEEMLVELDDLRKRSTRIEAQLHEVQTSVSDAVSRIKTVEAGQAVLASIDILAVLEQIDALDTRLARQKVEISENTSRFEKISKEIQLLAEDLSTASKLVNRLETTLSELRTQLE